MAAVFLFLAVLLVSLNPVWIQLALWNGATPLAIVFWQALFASALFFLYSIAKDRKIAFPGPQIVVRLLAPGIAFFIMSLLFTSSLHLLGASLTVLLFFSYPIFVSAGSALFFALPPSRRDILALAAVSAGVAAVAGPPPGEVLRAALLLPVGAAGAYAFFILYSEQNLRLTKPFTAAMFTQFGFLAGALLLLPFLAPGSLAQPAAAACGLTMAVLASFTGFLLFLKGVAGLGAGKAAVYSVVNLPLSLLFTGLLLGERLDIRLSAAFALILTGAVLKSRAAIRMADRLKED